LDKFAQEVGICGTKKNLPVTTGRREGRAPPLQKRVVARGGIRREVGRGEDDVGKVPEFGGGIEPRGWKEEVTIFEGLGRRRVIERIGAGILFVRGLVHKGEG